MRAGAPGRGLPKAGGRALSPARGAAQRRRLDATLARRLGIARREIDHHEVAQPMPRLGRREDVAERAVEELVKYLPVLAYDGANMTQIDAGGILDIAMAGTSATLLARKWESALLVNVDNDTLRRILDNPEAMAAVERIEGWRSLGDNIIETIINKSDKIKDLKNKRRGRIEEYVKEFKGASYTAGKTPWGVTCDVAMPCATQNELLGADAEMLIKNGCMAVSEGANMPTDLDGVHIFKKAKILFAPGKAANAGGVAGIIVINVVLGLTGLLVCYIGALLIMPITIVG